MSINNNIKFLLDLEEENIVENNFLRNDYVVLKNGVTAKSARSYHQTVRLTHTNYRSTPSY